MKVLGKPKKANNYELLVGWGVESWDRVCRVVRCGLHGARCRSQGVRFRM